MQYNVMCLLTLVYVRISKDRILNGKKEKQFCITEDMYVYVRV